MTIPYAARWRAFIGVDVDHPDIILLDAIYPTLVAGDGWSQARNELAAQIEPFLTDECWDCRLSGVAAFNSLAALAYQQEWEAEIDGNDYTLTRLPPDEE